MFNENDLYQIDFFESALMTFINQITTSITV